MAQLHSPRRNILLAALLLATVACAPWLLTGCESKPAEPVFDNAFDPSGPESGDPFHISATMGDTSITVIWTQPQDLGISVYEVGHSTNAGASYEIVGTVDHTSGETAFFSYGQPKPTSIHYFRVTAFTALGDYSLVSNQVPAVVVSPPGVTVGDGSGKVASHFAILTVTVTSGETLRISADPDFAVQTEVPVVELGQPQEIPWDLGPAAANGEKFYVYVTHLPTVSLVNTSLDSVEVDFSPDFRAAAGGQTVASRLLELTVDITGVLAMRFAPTVEALADVEYADPDPNPVHLLLDTAGEQTVYGEFQGDFGFTTITQATFTPDLLTEASFDLDIEADGTTEEAAVPIICSAVATLMRFSEDPGFADTEWIEYANQHVFTLSPGAGRKVIHGQFRNDWTDSPILTEDLVYLEAPLTVAFLTPTDGDVVVGGTTLEVLGTVDAAFAGAIDSVKVDLGDGNGFLEVETDGTWSLPWEIPLFTADTEVVLRARAWADTDSTTAQVQVTVSQLLVAIDEPLGDFSVAGGAELIISGTASAILGGAPLDEVTLDINGETFAAEGLESWSFTWTAPEVTEELAVTITVTAAAGEETAQSVVRGAVVP